jgi:adenylate kinase family enzyme
MRRVVVLGTSGSGKTTLARELARRMNAAHIELDALHWGPNWTSPPKPVFRRCVEQAIAQEAWALCGNYATVRDMTLARADTAIWLDYPMRVVFTRAFLRTIRRGISRELLWGTNRESLWINFFSRESLLLWVINTWRIRRRDYPKMLRGEKCRHLRVLRFRSPEETEAWLDRVEVEYAGSEQERPEDSADRGIAESAGNRSGAVGN